MKEDTDNLSSKEAHSACGEWQGGPPPVHCYAKSHTSHVCVDGAVDNMKPSPAAQPKGGARARWKPARMSTNLAKRWPPTQSDADDAANKPKDPPKQVSLFDKAPSASSSSLAASSSSSASKSKPVKPTTAAAASASSSAQPSKGGGGGGVRMSIGISKSKPTPTSTPTKTAAPKATVTPTPAPKAAAAAPMPAAAASTKSALTTEQESRIDQCRGRLEALVASLSGITGAAAALPPSPGIPVPAAVAPPPVAAAPAPSSSSSAGGSGGGGARAMVLAELNKGAQVTSGLRKVTKDMKTKYRPKGERSGLVSAAPKKSATPSKWSASRQTTQKAPSISRKQQTLFVENFRDDAQVQLEEAKDDEDRAKHEEQSGAGYYASMKENVFVYGCGAATIHVPSKSKGVTIDSCKKTRVVLKSVVSTVEVVNCQSVTVIVTGLVNSFAIDKTSGCQLWLSEETAHVQPDIFTSSISEVNVQVPGVGGGDDADPIEFAVPEQFKTVIEYERKREGDKTVLGPVKGLKTESVKHG